MSENQKKSPIVPILIVITALLAIGNVFQYTSSSATIEEQKYDIDSLVAVRVDLESNIRSMQGDIDKYKDENKGLNEMLTSREQELADKVSKIQELTRKKNISAAEIAQLRKLNKELETDREKLLEEIDKYITENQSLKTENKELYSAVSALEAEKSALNEQVNIASVVKTEYVNVTAFKPRGENFKETGLARRTSKFEVCMNLLENKVTTKGKKIVYVSIIAPNEKTVGDKAKGSGTFTTPNSEEEVFFTMSKEIDFTGATMENVCMSYDEGVKDRFEEGVYAVKIYIDGILTKITSIELK